MIAPLKVLLLVPLTLSLYLVIWGWFRTREADRSTRGASRTQAPFRLGVWIGLGALVPLVPGWLMTGGIQERLAAPAFPTEPTFGVVLLVIGAVLVLASTVLTYAGFWRLWRFVQGREPPGVSSVPMVPALMLAFTLIPIVNYVGMLYVPYRTQQGLNAIWRQGRHPGGDTAASG